MEVLGKALQNETKRLKEMRKREKQEEEEARRQAEEKRAAAKELKAKIKRQKKVCGISIDAIRNNTPFRGLIFQQILFSVTAEEIIIPSSNFSVH